jgi:PadR family transcriptional regulator, regulatory protein PadR
MPPQINRELTAASAIPLVLSILASGESYGYSLIKRVKELSGGAVEWTEGMLYPVLHRLEEQALVESYWEGESGGRRRKFYRVTAAGRAALDSLLEQWRAVDSALQKSQEGGDSVRS